MSWYEFLWGFTSLGFSQLLESGGLCVVLGFVNFGETNLGKFQALFLQIIFYSYPFLFFQNPKDTNIISFFIFPQSLRFCSFFLSLFSSVVWVA